jgi:NADH-quinone oxidoreductase subunit E
MKKNPQSTPRLLDEDLRQAIREHFPRYPTRQAVVLPALHLVSERLGYVPLPAVVEIAELLGLAPAQVQDTLSFYGFFPQDKPQGTHRIWVCRSLSCAAREGEELLDYLAKKLGIGPGQTTPDGRITLESAECIGACDGAPAMLVDHTVYRDLSKEKIDRIVESLLKEESV